MTPQGILFDLDNTLAHRDWSIASYARRFARDFGDHLDEVDADVIAALMMERDNGGYGIADSPFPTVRDDVAHALAMRLCWQAEPEGDELVRHWFAHFPAHSVEMPGATAVLERMATAGLRVGIVSNGAEASRRELARCLGFDRRIATLVSSERAGMNKPDPRIFALAAAELGVATDQCWFVGDHPVNDVAGAHAAGMRALWLSGFHHWPDGVAAMPAIASLAELDALVLR